MQIVIKDHRNKLVKLYKIVMYFSKFHNFFSRHLLICFWLSYFQVMIQPQKRNHSMSIYLAAIAIPDTIILCLGKLN